MFSDDVLVLVTRKALFPGALACAATAFRILIRAYKGGRASVLAARGRGGRACRNRGSPAQLRTWTTLLPLPEALTVVGAWSEAAALYPIVREAIDKGRHTSPVRHRPPPGGSRSGSAPAPWPCAPRRRHTGRPPSAAGAPASHSAARGASLVRPDAAPPRWRRDRDEAQELLMQAIDGYLRLGMPRHLEMVRAVLQPSRSASGLPCDRVDEHLCPHECKRAVVRHVHLTTGE
jgi:hypothetical protein